MKHYTSFEDFINEAYDMNDPVLMAFRAAKMKREKELAKPKRKPLYGKQRLKAEDDLWYISQDLKDLYADRGQLLIDMEQEAEAEGGPIADEYGDKLNKIEDEIQKLIAKRNQLEMRLAESVSEAYTDDDVNMLYGFYGQIETCFDEKKAKKLFDQGVLDLQKKYKLSEESALAVLNSKMGRKAADQICDKQAKTAVEGLETYYTKSLQKEISVVIKESVVTEQREDVGKYNTVKKAMKAIRHEYGPTPTPQSVASFINDNYYDVTEVERGDDDPSANDKIADLVASYKFDIEEWEIAWADAQNESIVNEAKSLDREEMMDWLDQTLTFTRTSEEFDGSKGGIWTTGENGEQYKGKRIYDYYSEDYKNRTFGVLNSWEKELNKRGWYSEWYDAGTVMIWPN